METHHQIIDWHHHGIIGMPSYFPQIRITENKWRSAQTKMPNFLSSHATIGNQVNRRTDYEFSSTILSSFQSFIV